MLIFTVKSKENKLIRLTVKQWKHIVYRHPEMTNKLIQIEKTIIYPDYIKACEENIIKYYKYIKEEAKYIVVAVKMLNGEGFIVTSYLTRKIQK